MVTVNDVPTQDFITALAAELRAMPELTAPEWAFYVKTGVHKERPPVEKDWWHIRAASVLRTVFERGPIGVNKIRSKYGGKKNRGVKPSHTFKGSGSIARKILQQLQAAELIKQDQKGVHKGRVVTPKGIALLNKAAAAVHKLAPKPVEEPKAPVEKPKEAPKATEQKQAEKPKEPAKGKPVEESKVPEKPKEAPKAAEKSAPAERPAEAPKAPVEPIKKEAPAKPKEEPKPVEAPKPVVTPEVPVEKPAEKAPEAAPETPKPEVQEQVKEAPEPAKEATPDQAKEEPTEKKE